jgi:hypothetical protein
MESNGLGWGQILHSHGSISYQTGVNFYFYGVIFLFWAITHKHLGQGHRGQLTPFVYSSSATVRRGGEPDLMSEDFYNSSVFQ